MVMNRVSNGTIVVTPIFSQQASLDEFSTSVARNWTVMQIKPSRRRLRWARIRRAAAERVGTVA
jgi:hypothetical protein